MKKPTKSHYALAMTIGLLLIFVVAGYVLPALLIKDGTEQYEGAQREAAKQALSDLNTGGDGLGKLARLYILKLKVVGMRERALEPNDFCQESKAYVSTVQPYTYFGIPIAIRIEVDCSGSYPK